MPLLCGRADWPTCDEWVALLVLNVAQVRIRAAARARHHLRMHADPVSAMHQAVPVTGKGLHFVLGQDACWFEIVMR